MAPLQRQRALNPEAGQGQTVEPRSLGKVSKFRGGIVLFSSLFDYSQMKFRTIITINIPYNMVWTPSNCSILLSPLAISNLCI